MDISGFMGGNFYSQVDLAAPAQVMTIDKVDQRLVGQGPQAEQKVCITTRESAKPLALNKTNLKRVAAMYGTDASQWVGKQLLFYRTTTDYAGKVTLCVRVCGPQQAPPDPVCDQQGNAVPYGQAIAPPPPTAPVAAPQPAVTQAAPQQPAAPWEQQHNPPPAQG